LFNQGDKAFYINDRAERLEGWLSATTCSARIPRILAVMWEVDIAAA